MNNTCDKCVTKPKAKGLCKSHYERYRLTRTNPCTVAGCDKNQSYIKLGLCLAHYQQTPQGQHQKLKSVYGISLDSFNELLEIQNGKCAICRQPESKKQRLSVDHDHNTGEVRGLLCFACNAGIGFLQDSSKVLQKAAKYLKEKGK
jgi:hypothetical protein